MANNQADDKGRRAPAAKRGPMSLREAQTQLTRDRLIDAAFEIFEEKGFRASTIEQIMKRAGANRATFYRHFNDKTEVAFALGQRNASEYTKPFRELDNMVNPTVRDIRGWVESYLALISEAPVHHQVMHEAISVEAKFGDEDVAYLGRIADICMAKTVARFGKRRESVRSKIVLLIMMMHRYAVHTISLGLEFPGDSAAVDAIAEMWHGALFAKSPGSGLTAAAKMPAKPRTRLASAAAKRVTGAQR